MTKEEMLSFIDETRALGSRLGLSRIMELMERLSNVHDLIPAIHIAGTNGKGSVSAYLSSILMAAGKKTGLFTSPAIGSENERIRIDNVPITDDEAAEVFSDVKSVCDEMEKAGYEHPTEFEIVTAAAFLFFYRKGCDIMVLETGMGGRLDSTNVIKKPLLSIITSISFDHTAFLGNTLSDIAAEKAGIIKENCPVLVQKQSEDAVTDVFKRKASSLNAKFHEVKTPALISRDLSGQSFSVDGLSLKTSLLGTYQLQNAATAVSAARLLPIPDDAIRRGIEDTRWEARFELLRRDPLFFCDGGHNIEGAKVLYESLTTYFPGKKVIFIS
ncbi:MAG: bifunctional folylpolyglutamate synthase/dihydrofolate synthase, partial [Lachnospiraceae bacterium]|nr:bifunctional folylpolyglutamate synthase/dihydrofolate synthase [Lachnospiraceae bacterium]